MQNVEAFYKMMRDTGDLQVLFSDMTGEWSKDKKEFTKQYKRGLTELRNNPSVDLDIDNPDDIFTN